MSRRHLFSLQHWDWNFEGGAADNVTEVSGSIRISPRLDWSSKWCHYAIRSDSMGGKTPKFIIDKATRWFAPAIGSEIENVGVWSTALDTDNWYNFDNQVSSGTDIELYNSKPFPNSRIYVAHMAIYPVSRLMRKYSEWRTRDSRIIPLSIGQDTRRSNGDGRVSSAYPFIGFKITNDSGYSKNKVVICAGNHPSEFQGMFAMEGAIEALLSGSAEAEFLLDWANVYIYPMLNPQGIGGGWFRRSPQSSTDNNRLWDGSGASDAVDAFKTSFASELGSSVDCALDLHGSLNQGAHYQSCADHTQAENVFWDVKMETLLIGSTSLTTYDYVDETVASMLRVLFETSYSAIFAISTERMHLRRHTQSNEFKTMGEKELKIVSSMIGNLTFTYGPDMGSREGNGTTDRIDWSNVLDPSGQALTVSAWVYVDAIAHNSYVLCIHDSSNIYGLVFNLVDTTTPTIVRRGSSQDYLWNATWTIPTSQWIHVLWTSDGGLTSSSVAFYGNGLSKTVTFYTGTGSETAHTGGWSLIGRLNDDNRNLDGKIAQVGYWNRVLTAEEINRLAFGCAPEVIGSGLQFYFKGNTTSLVANPPNSTGTADGTTHVSGVGNGPAIIYS